MKDDQESKSDHRGRRGCILSGLINVLDAVAAKEGRVVVMTSNYADKLDEGLIRPDHIDRQVYHGHISPRIAMIMFLIMYYKAQNLDIGDKELRDLAFTCSSKIPEKASRQHKSRAIFSDSENHLPLSLPT